MAKRRRVAKPQKNRRVALLSGNKPRAVARSNRRKALVVIGTHKFAVKVTCAGKIHMTRSGRKAYNAQKRKLKVRCAKSKRVVRGGRAKRGSRYAATFSTLGAGRRGFWQW